MSLQGELIRRVYEPDVTLGWMEIGGIKIATLEEGWKADPDGPGGQRREGSLIESCIPDGDYEIRPHFSTKYPSGCWYLVNEKLGVYAPGKRPKGQSWGREAILIHVGNTTKDIEGCILVGMIHGKLNNMPAVLSSKPAFTQLAAVLGFKETHRLTIRPTRGTSELKLG